MNACIVFFNSNQIESVRIYENSLENKIWSGSYQKKESIYQTLSLELQSSQEMIFVGETQASSDFRKWLLLHNRSLTKKLIAVVNHRSFSKESLSMFKEKYFGQS